jgi:hypothetical protein
VDVKTYPPKETPPMATRRTSEDINRIQAAIEHGLEAHDLAAKLGNLYNGQDGLPEGDGASEPLFNDGHGGRGFVITENGKRFAVVVTYDE